MKEVKETKKDRNDLKEEKVKNNVKKRKKINKDNLSFNLIEVIVIMIITSIFGILVGSCVTYFRENNITINNDSNSSTDLKEFIKVYNDILSDSANEVESDELLESAIKGMVNYLGDPYSIYLSSEEAQDFNDTLNGEFVGIGVTVSVTEDGKISVIDVLEDSSAKKAGIEVGDEILGVDDYVANADINELSSKIRGKEGTKVTLKIKRNDKEMDLEVQRSKVTIDSVFSHTIDRNGKKIGYVSITVFAKNTQEQFEKHLDNLVKNGINDIVIDVRDNTGGHLEVGYDIASLFLDKGTVVYQLKDKDKVTKVKSKVDKKYDLNVVLLTNEGTASASEILVSALKENLNIKTVGMKTYGKGTVQRAYTLKSGATLKYTIENFLTSKGNVVNEVGIKPDYEVNLNKIFLTSGKEEDDNQLQKAIDVLLGNE